jgi:hypothetical protein
MYQAILTESKHRFIYADSWASFGRASLALVRSTTPELTDPFVEIANWCGKLGLIHHQLAEAQQRTADDFRDIFERSKVVERVSQELQTVQGWYADASVQLSQAIANKADATNVSSSAETAALLQRGIDRAKEHKNEYKQLLKQKVAELIQAKEKYAIFRIRKLKGGLIGYLGGLKTAAKCEVVVIDNLKKLMGKLSVGSSVLLPEFQQFEREFCELMEAKPAPAVEGNLEPEALGDVALA